VFDLDCMTLLDIARTLRDEHCFQSGRKVTFAPRVFLGAAENPFAPPFEWRPSRLAKKIDAGAQFVQTQYCYDIARLKAFMERAAGLGLPERAFILVGVGPLRSAKAAEWMRTHVPGVHIPDDVIRRVASADDQAKEGRRVCVDIIREIREIKGVAGVHVMAYRQEEAVAEVITESGALNGRVPWYPDRTLDLQPKRAAS
jgi:methylenetetrahydrofolate reductase (NADPH)